MWWALLILGGSGVADGENRASSALCPGDVPWEAVDEGSGPFRLASLECRDFRGNLSPDGSWYFLLTNEGLMIATDGDVDGHIFRIGRPGPARTPEASQWSSSSDFVWGAERDRVGGGWSAGPIELFKFFPDGRREALPSPQHPAGPLDAIEWIGGDGLALVQFGSRGGYNRPERTDHDPTLGIIDAASGRVLQALSMKAIPAARSAQGKPMIPLIRATAYRTGKPPHVLLQWPTRLALHWTLGTEPVAVAPIKDDWHQKLVLDPDGKWLLVAPTLSVASIAECHEDQECPAEPPVTGPALQLYDLATHKQLWSISETTPSWGGPAQPVVGPGGKYAVMPVDAVKGRVCLVVDMKHGEVVQRIKCEGPSETIRFSQDGKSFAIFGNSRITRFEFSPQ